MKPLKNYGGGAQNAYERCFLIRFLFEFDTAEKENERERRARAREAVRFHSSALSGKWHDEHGELAATVE